MVLEPGGMENIIVGLLLNEQFKWYVSPRELWFMDKKKREYLFVKKFRELGLRNIGNSFSCEDERKGIEVLDSNTVLEFTSRIARYSTPTDVLRRTLESRLLCGTKEDVFYDFLPSLYVDFDKKELYSMFTEPASYEDYVPSDWKGYYNDFLDKVSTEEKYWLSDTGIDLLGCETEGRV